MTGAPATPELFDREALRPILEEFRDDCEVWFAALVAEHPPSLNVSWATASVQDVQLEVSLAEVVCNTPAHLTLACVIAGADEPELNTLARPVRTKWANRGFMVYVFSDW